MKKNGQALIEFIIILPVLILIFLAIIDFGLIFSKNNNLENTINEVVNRYENKETFVEIEKKIKTEQPKIKLTITNDDNHYVRITLLEEYKVITPGLNLILGNPYNIEVKRVIYYE